MPRKKVMGVEKILVTVESQLLAGIDEQVNRLKQLGRNEDRGKFINGALKRERKYRKGLLNLLKSCHAPLGTLEGEKEQTVKREETMEDFVTRMNKELRP